jgi:hypothetical protein
MLSLFTCTGRSWRERPEIVLGALRQTLAIRGEEGPIVKLDDASLAAIRDGGGAAPHRLVDLKDLLREVTNDYEPDARAIDQLMGSLSSDSVLVLDAAAFPYPAVSKALAQFRATMFTRADWPAAILLMVGEQSLDVATSELAATFYVLPVRRSMAEASIYAYQLHRIATWARMLGRAFKMTKSIERFKRKRLKQDEVDFT